MPTLELDHLTKTYGTGDATVHALTDMTFTVAPGEIYGFVGSNGAGKSTAMRITLGVLAPDSGEARVDGVRINDDIRRTIGYMPEERGLYDKERITDQLIFFGRLHGLTKQAATRNTADLLDQLGLAGRAQSKLQELSLGNQQRVQLAASLIHDPELLILDEPFSGLDPVAVSVMSDLLVAKAAEGVPVLFSSHQLDLVQRLCHRVGIITAGEMRAQGTVTAREIQVAVHSKGLVITAALTLVAVVAGILGVHFFGGDDDEAPDLVVTGMDTTAVSRVLGDSVDVTAAPDRDAAVAAVKDDGKDGALIRGDDGFELVTDGTADPVVASAAQIAASAVAQDEALTAVGVAPEAFAAALPDATVHATDVSDAAREDRLPAIVTTMVGTMVILMFILTFSANVGGRVTEEKSSRVVEIILATIRPLELLAGKVLAMLVVGLACTAVILAVALATMSAIGVLADVDLSPAIVLVLLVAYILGMLFFSALYAAAGSLVSKAEELSSTQMPVMLVFFAVMYPPLLGFNSLDSTFLQVLSWIPPMSLGLAPLQFAAGNFSLWQLGASFVVLAAATVLVLLLVARIYRSAILNNGRRLSWFRALRTA